MPQTIKVDPVTRVEGHLKVEATLDDDNVVDEARCIGTLFRGIEVILKDRDPRDALFITQRICGVCPTAHATASVLALDDAFDVAPPSNGRIIRNLILGANFIQSHLLHFYHLAGLDYAKGPDRAPFLPRYEGDTRLSEAQNQRIVDHYLKALKVRMKAQEMVAIFGGKMPHIATFLPGGVTEMPEADEIARFHSILNLLRDFVDATYIPDVLTVAAAYDDYFSVGPSCGGLLAHGGFPLDDDGETMLFPGGVYADGELSPFNAGQIAEDVRYAWYHQRTTGQHPSEGTTKPEATGILKPEAYSWVKAPRYDGRPLEAGPLARMMVAYQSGASPAVTDLVDETLAEAGLSLNALCSVMGRHLARALECKVIADAMEDWLWQLDLDGTVYAHAGVPDSADGVGLAEAPRGALGHWLRVAEGKIANYQVITPTNWNASPHDDDGHPGPLEQTLVGTPIRDPHNPVEIVRTVRAFDPCLACAVHLATPKRDLGAFRVV